MLMLSNANNTVLCYNDIDDKFWDGQRTTRRRRPKVVPRAAAGYARQLKKLLKILPFFFCFSMKSSLYYRCKVEASYTKSEFFGSVCEDDFTIFDCEIIEDIVQVCFSTWFFFIPDEFTVVFQYEIPWSPVFQMFGWKKIKSFYKTHKNSSKT